MAVVEIGLAHQDFIGGPSDTKPTEGVPPGSTFSEVYPDGSVRRYIFTGADWCMDPVSQMAVRLEALLS